MWIVRLALKQPHTIVVLTVLIFLLGTLAIVRTPTDIFPNSDIHLGHRALPDATTVDNIQHIESQSFCGRLACRRLRRCLMRGGGMPTWTKREPRMINRLPIRVRTDGTPADGVPSNEQGAAGLQFESNLQ